MYNKKRGILIIISLLLGGEIWAFPCQYVVSKNCCWTDFNVNVSVLNAGNKKVLSQLTVPTGKSTLESSFDCQPGQSLELTATFSPEIWEGDKNKVFRSKGFIALKTEIAPDEVAWRIPIVFPDQFSGVPLPLDTTNCQCAK